MVNIGIIVDGETEMKLFNSKEIKEQLKNNFDVNIVGVVKYSGAGSIKNNTQDFLAENIEKIIIIKDLEQLPCISSLKTQLNKNDTFTNENILIVAKKMIEAWFLADTETLSKILKQPNLKPIKNPENYKNPYKELKKILTSVNKNYKRLTKPAIANLFIKNGFSFENANNHSQCHSVSYFVKTLRDLNNQ